MFQLERELPLRASRISCCIAIYVLYKSDVKRHETQALAVSHPLNVARLMMKDEG